MAARIAQPYQLRPATWAKAVNFLRDLAAAGASRRKRKIENQTGRRKKMSNRSRGHRLLLTDALRRTSGQMTSDLFDRRLRAVRRDRAARAGTELLLYDRAFNECLDRLQDIRRSFDRCLLIGVPSPEWPERIRGFSKTVDVVDPGSLFAAAAGGRQIEEDRYDFGEDRYDLVLAIGTLDTVNDLPLALQRIRMALRPESLLIGAIAGGHSLPGMRSSLIAGGRAAGRTFARTHPRIEAQALTGLLTAAGYSLVVVDIDRVTLRYSDIKTLVNDLRKMGASSMLADRPPAMTRQEFEIVRAAFAQLGSEGRTEEQVDILHFAGWRQ